ncbi:MAG: IS1380 family transposase [Actinomycetota bacterium]|nr:IS1380 family transposase [Actinomycetota bacterium]
MNANSTRRVVVEPGGAGVAAHVGLHALGAFADRLSLGDALSSWLPWAGAGIPVHDRGKVLVQSALMLAGGGESCLDIEFLRTGDHLFGAVPSDTTVARTFHEITPARRAALVGAVAQVRHKVWRRSQATKDKGPVILDIDASLVDIHSENKEQAAPTYKGGYGFHPMFCFADATGEALAALLRPGNAGANAVADHISVLDGAIAQLPGDIAAGHRAGDGQELVEKAVVVRADSAGCTEDFLKACRERHVGFYVSARSNAQVSAAIFDAIGIEEVWLAALAQDGEEKDGSAVAELTSLIEDRKLPEGTRLIVRREPLHPGAQRSLFPSLDYRYWGFYTDQAGDPRDLDVTMRAHAHVEQHICRLKDSGLCRFPFSSFEDNTTWLTVVALAADLVRWFQLLCLEGAWCDARPKALRWGIFHAPGRLVHSARRRIVRIIENWPTADVLLGAYRRIALIT